MRRPIRLLAPLLLLVLAAAPAARAAVPTPGSSGLGDRLYPKLGNGGYDVANYKLDLRYATSDPAQAVLGTATIKAKATKALSRFDLDFGGDSVGSVRVDGAAARWHRDGEELVITPAQPLQSGRSFTVEVAGFTAHPTVPDPNDPRSTAFFITPSGSATAPQPIYAHDIFPSNDHPRDKATFTFDINVPKGETAVANGDLVGVHPVNDRATWEYRMARPMATELTQIAVGNWDRFSRGTHAGVDVTDVLPPSLAGLRGDLKAEDAHLGWLQQRLGTYPFSTYGSFVVDTDLGFALETQSISLFDRPWFTAFDRGVWDPTMLHELTHQWFGDSVSPWSWSDVWLNEGHASWYEEIWAARHGWLGDDTGTGIEDFTQFIKSVYAEGDQLRADWGPVARPASNDIFDLFSPNVYEGGSLVLFALRQKVGDDDFARIERTFLAQYRDRSASTDDFIRVASTVSGKNLGPFLRRWVYGTTTPPMPGHPDWTVDPVTAGAAPQGLLPSESRRP